MADREQQEIDDWEEQLRNNLAAKRREVKKLTTFGENVAMLLRRIRYRQTKAQSAKDLELKLHEYVEARFPSCATRWEDPAYIAEEEAECRKL